MGGMSLSSNSKRFIASMAENNLPSISVVTPSYNQAPYIEDTIRSVLDQNYPHLDYLVMDGGSNDGTVDILRRYEGKLRWVSEKDRGQSDAINKGFARTKGDILAWMNSDDIYAPGALHAAAECFAKNPDVDVVYGDASFIDANGKRVCPCAQIEPYNWKRLLYYSDFIVQPAAFFRRSAFEAVGGVDVDLHWTMDYDLWLRLGRQFKFYYLPQELGHFRWLGSNKTGVGGRHRMAEVEKVTRRQGVNGLPALFRLEMVRLNIQEALQACRRREFKHIGLCARSSLQNMASWRACISLLHPLTWRIICTGQVLRQRTAGVVKVS